MENEPTWDPASRRRVSTACEPCRASKIKCRPSDRLGVCQKCLESKTECVSRTGPRVRRRKAQILQEAENAKSRASPAAATFSIDFEVSAQQDTEEDFDTLKEIHGDHLDKLFPSVEDAIESGLVMPALATPPASSTHSQPLHDTRAKPSFNVASAEKLLGSFHSMLEYYPCVLLAPDVTVSQLARTKPFVLLAILAATSASRTLQGHSLYDEEFRKVLGLKFVAGGERTLELLQGLLIYCSWYPFHLRPKNKQAFQYLRMAGDLIRDLELDEDSRDETIAGMTQVTDEQLASIRAYLSFYLTCSGFMIAWKKRAGITLNFTTWTATCCDLLEQHAQADGDVVLANLVRLSNTAVAAGEAFQEKFTPETAQQSQLVLLGLESQLHDTQRRIQPHILAKTPIKLATLFASIHLDGGTLLTVPRFHSAGSSIAPSSQKLCLCVESLRLFFKLMLDLEPGKFLYFASYDWSFLIMAVILAIRLSFPIQRCAEWDHTWARSHLSFAEFLETMTRETDLTPASKKVDVLSAFRVVLRMVKKKYDDRVSKVAPVISEDKARTCPMLDGSMDQFLPLWDPAYDITSSLLAPDGVGQMTGGQPVFHDVWATMTMNWANED